MAFHVLSILGMLLIVHDIPLTLLLALVAQRLPLPLSQKEPWCFPSLSTSFSHVRHPLTGDVRVHVYVEGCLKGQLDVSISARLAKVSGDSTDFLSSPRSSP